MKSITWLIIDFVPFSVLDNCLKFLNFRLGIKEKRPIQRRMGRNLLWEQKVQVEIH
jgi:hypothetical protein